MLTNYYTLRFIASTLDSTTKGWKIRDVFTQRKDELKIQFFDDLLTRLHGALAGAGGPARARRDPPG